MNKLNASDTLSKELIAKAFFRPPKLIDDSTSHTIFDKLSISHSTFQTAPCAPGTNQFSESYTSISIGNGLSSPARRLTHHSPRRSPRRTISSSPSKRCKPRYQKSKRLNASCPHLEYITASPPLLGSVSKNSSGNEDCVPEKDEALGKKAMQQIEAYKDFFQQCRPSRRKVKFEIAEEKQCFSASHIDKLSVDDLQFPCSNFPRRKQFEVIRELERDIRSSSRQLDRLEEMITYEVDIAQELERTNQTIRRKVLAFPSSIPSKRDLKEQIKEVERALRAKGYVESAKLELMGKRNHGVVHRNQHRKSNRLRHTVG